MSHDRGCSCGKEWPDEYATCTHKYCMKRPAPAPEADLIESPDHYVSADGLQPIELIMSTDHDGKFCKGNIIKYAFRAGSKLYDGYDITQSEIKDLEKVKQYADFRIRQLRGEPIIPRQNNNKEV